MLSPAMWRGDGWRDKMQSCLLMAESCYNHRYDTVGTIFIDAYLELFAWLGGVRVYEEATLLGQADYSRHFPDPKAPYTEPRVTSHEAPLSQWATLIEDAASHLATGGLQVAPQALSSSQDVGRLVSSLIPAEPR
jgi:hypothetical protein